MVKLLFLPSCLAAAVLVSSCKKNEPLDEAQWIERGQSTLLPFKKQLMSALKEGLTEGPVAALEACQFKAPQIADGLKSQTVAIGRSSHKVRNAANAAEAWMLPVLEEYKQSSEMREPRAIALEDDLIAYVEPIVMKPMCVTCHGEVVPETVEQKLATLYPDDRARGFKAGDFRGIFWVKFQQAIASSE